jgi:hypothetical protein
MIAARAGVGRGPADAPLRHGEQAVTLGRNEVVDLPDALGERGARRALASFELPEVAATAADLLSGVGDAQAEPLTVGADQGGNGLVGELAVLIFSNAVSLL